MQPLKPCDLCSLAFDALPRKWEVLKESDIACRCSGSFCAQRLFRFAFGFELVSGSACYEDEYVVASALFIQATLWTNFIELLKYFLGVCLHLT